MDTRLQEEGVSNPYDLADKSYLDEACEVVTELKARQRMQNVMARETGTENKHPNPLIDRHMDVDVIKNFDFFSRPTSDICAPMRKNRPSD